jgi:hypothetical protein
MHQPLLQEGGCGGRGEGREGPLMGSGCWLSRALPQRKSHLSTEPIAIRPAGENAGHAPTRKCTHHGLRHCEVTPEPQVQLSQAAPHLRQQHIPALRLLNCHPAQDKEAGKQAGAG